jgi:hypothetical protein
MKIEKEHCAHGLTAPQGSPLPGQAWPSLASPAPRPLLAHGAWECVQCAVGIWSPPWSVTSARGVVQGLTAHRWQKLDDSQREMAYDTLSTIHYTRT